jgi:hypothetical protein
MTGHRENCWAVALEGVQLGSARNDLKGKEFVVND